MEEDFRKVGIFIDRAVSLAIEINQGTSAFISAVGISFLLSSVCRLALANPVSSAFPYGFLLCSCSKFSTL